MELFSRDVSRPQVTASDVRRRSLGPAGERQTVQEWRSLRHAAELAQNEERASPLSGRAYVPGGVGEMHIDSCSSSAGHMSPGEWVQRREWISEAQHGALVSSGLPTPPGSPADRVSAVNIPPQSVTTDTLAHPISIDNAASSAAPVGTARGERLRLQYHEQRHAPLIKSASSLNERRNSDQESLALPAVLLSFLPIMERPAVAAALENADFSELEMSVEQRPTDAATKLLGEALGTFRDVVREEIAVILKQPQLQRECEEVVKVGNRDFAAVYNGVFQTIKHSDEEGSARLEQRVSELCTELQLNGESKAARQQTGRAPQAASSKVTPQLHAVICKACSPQMLTIRLGQEYRRLTQPQPVGEAR